MMGPGDRFVVVSYDFEYSTEEGKRVWMKEGEVLLLLSKTNNDWWQVIRRGDRRPFYAPARYVAELGSDGNEWDNVFQEDGIHYRPDNGEPLPTRMDPYQEKKNQFSTFLGGGANKRSSYAAPPPAHHGPPSADFLFGQPRFQERYRSNSMDSLLVQDLNRAVFKPRHQPNNIHLEKRPTFDNIDKRASWSHDKPNFQSRSSYPMYNNSVLPPVIQPAAVPAYHAALHHAAGLPHPAGNGLPLHPHHPGLHHPATAAGGPPPAALHPPGSGGHKKPIPLPRSKIPLPTPKSATVDRLGPPQHPSNQQPELRTFKRSKTDLSLGMINQYKANRATGGVYSPPNLRHQQSGGGGGGSISSSGSHGRSSAATAGSVLSSGSGASRTRSKAGRGGSSSPTKSSLSGGSQVSAGGSGFVKSGGSGGGQSNGGKDSAGGGSARQNLAAVKPGYGGGSKSNQRRQSTSRPTRPAGPVIPEENIQAQKSAKNDLRQKESLNIQENSRKKRSATEEGGGGSGGAPAKTLAPLVSPPKPALASKPSVPVIKSSLVDKEARDTNNKEVRERDRRRNLRAQSDTDILNKVNAELSTQPNFRLDAPISNSITAAKDSAARVITNRDRLPSFQSEDTVKSNSVVAGRKLNESANPNFLDSPRDRESEDELKISLKVEGFERLERSQHQSYPLPTDPIKIKQLSESAADRTDAEGASETGSGYDRVVDYRDRRPSVAAVDVKQQRRPSRDDNRKQSAERTGGGSIDHRLIEPAAAAGTDRTSRDRSEIKENLNPKTTTAASTTTSVPLTSAATTTTANTGQKQSSSSGQSKFRSKKETNEKFLDMEPLPEPPPTPPRTTSPINIPPAAGGGEPLVISTEPMSTSSSGHNKSEDKSNCSSSFDSLDGSLDSGGWPEGGDWLGSEPSRATLVSPNNSTCSRAPGSPLPGAVPVRVVFTDWGEYLDATGRKFYYNTKTKEKSWKPPRRIRRSSEGGQSAPTEGGYSAPTSPDPFIENVDSAFEMSPGLSESESRSVEDESIINQHHTKSANVLAEKSANQSEISSTTATTADSAASANAASTTSTSTKEDDSKAAASSSSGGEESREEWPPSGYEIKIEAGTGEQYFVNVFTGVAWYSALDKTGRTYYYEENGNQSCWNLPNVSQTFQDHSVNPSPVPDSDRQRRLAAELDNSASLDAQRRLAAAEPDTNAATADPKEQLPNLKIGDVSIVVVKQGALFKTRLEERGKKYRKNWSLMNLVLTDTFLLFYKDAKAFSNLQAGASHKPDQVIDLKGSMISWCNTDKSKRSNVFELDTLLEQKLLLQDDDFVVANDWFSRIENVIVRLNSQAAAESLAAASAARNTIAPPTDSASSTLNSKKSKISRTKSLKLLTAGGGKEGATATAVVGPESPSSVVTTPLVKEKLKIREKLLKFFLRRPNVEDLMKRGIIKNEPVFGSTLVLLAKAENTDVPLFVRKCIQIIESKPEYLSTDGVYRQSGNLSTVQRLRLQIDHGNTAVLDTVDDIHVLTGALKLFFRELKEPLIPWEAVERLMQVCNLPSLKAKVKGLKEVVTRLATPHQATLITLLRHLERVTTYKEVNRMAVSNLAIVFGPTLMWPPAHLTNTNMALNMMQQNMIVEALITHLPSLH